MDTVASASPQTPHPFTTVTPLSKAVALILFVTLPIGMFFLGMYIQSQSPTTSSQPTQTVSPTSAAVSPTPDETASWKTYTNATGNYSFKYPSNAQLLENKTLSVDGVKTQQQNTVAILSEEFGQGQLKIAYVPGQENVALNNFVDNESSCTSVTSALGKSFELGEEKALIFIDAPCGPSGATLVFALHGNIGYIIEVQGSSYKQTEENTNRFFSNFTFTK